MRLSSHRISASYLVLLHRQFKSCDIKGSGKAVRSLLTSVLGWTRTKIDWQLVNQINPAELWFFGLVCSWLGHDNKKPFPSCPCRGSLQSDQSTRCTLGERGSPVRCGERIDWKDLWSEGEISQLTFNRELRWRRQTLGSIMSRSAKSHESRRCLIKRRLRYGDSDGFELKRVCSWHWSPPYGAQAFLPP